VTAVAPTTGQFRTVAGKFPTGVTVVTVRSGDETFAKTVSSFSSVSLDPLLVSVCIGAASPMVPAARAAGGFAVNLLRADQEALCRRFASAGCGRSVGDADSVAMSTSPFGSALVDGCLGWFDCALDAEAPAGDHVMLLGLVRAAEADAGEPLLFFDGSFPRLATSRDDPRSATPRRTR
jgi:flavin reductase (DIM6/NTAB) family NADH-FMN oxidoreductase RutF